jgi:hypothetical protein
MNIITTEDGTQIYYKDWGSGHPVLAILYFAVMLAYHAWTSQGIKKKRREE